MEDVIFSAFIHKLLLDFYKITKSPILLNTSFNDREPIVETPEDAINCFLRTEIDYIFFGDFNILVAKSDSKESNSPKEKGDTNSDDVQIFI